jgi:hypothetical protein
MDPWDREWTLLKARRANIVAEREKMPFELTVSPVSSRGQRSKLPAVEVICRPRPLGPAKCRQLPLNRATTWRTRSRQTPGAKGAPKRAIAHAIVWLAEQNS